MIEKILSVYENLNSRLLNEKINNEFLRKKIVDELESELDCVAICDDDNNPTDVTKNCLAVATIIVKKPDNSIGMNYENLLFFDMIFGNPTQIKKMDKYYQKYVMK